MSSWFQSYGYGEILDDLLIGAYPLDRSDVALLKLIGVQRILNLVEDAEYRRGERATVHEALTAVGIEERRLQLVDYGRMAPEELEPAVTEVNSWLDQGVRTYVHCRAGWQRSAAVAAGVVAIRKGITIDAALELVRERKPTAEPLRHQVDSLYKWWATRQPADAE